MKHFNLKKLLAVTLVLAMALALMPTGAQAVTQAQIDALKEKRDEIAAKREAQQTVVDELKVSQADVLERKAALDERNAYTVEQIKLTDETIEMYSELIAEKAIEVAEARDREAVQLQRYRTRIRAMEENGTLNYLAMIFKANNLGELLTAIDDIGEIMASDKALEQQYIAAREETEAVKANFEAYKAEQEGKQAELLVEKQRLQDELEEANQLIREITADIEANAEALQEIEDALNKADEDINKLVEELEAQKAAEAAAREEERRRQQQESGGGGTIGGGGGGGGTVTGSGSFRWPVSCTYITSCVGYRYHPVSGEWKYHSGMDIGCQYGDSVWASDGGTVCLAGVNGGYGNCVMIDHGNGYYTLYGHLSSIACSNGQAVSQGTVIGYVGSTGVSTGPHLHFEIRQGSTCLDFASWFSGLTYAPDSGG